MSLFDVSISFGDAVLTMAVVFCEAIHGRWRTGERDDAWAGALADGVPRLAEVAGSYL